MMDHVTSDQIVPLVGMEQGQMMTIIVTGATTGGNCTLEFKNGGDSGWTVDPSFTGTVTDGTLIQRVRCLSAHTRLKRASVPSNNYRICVVFDVAPTF